MKPDQLDFESLWSDPPPPPASSSSEARMAFARRLEAVGLVYSANAFFNEKGTINNPLGLEHPSRMLKFPLHARNERVYVVHPRLADEPFVGEVERRLGERPVYDDCIADVRRESERQHALDLCRRDRYRLLLDTLHLTTKRAIVETVGAELRAACEPKYAITAAIAREILTALGVPETGWADDYILLESVDISWRVPMGAPARERDLLPQENAWDCVHAYETGIIGRGSDGRARPIRMPEEA